MEKGTAIGSSSGKGGYTVLLIGSTGNLGSYILEILLQTDWVSRVICLNRRPNASERQRQDFKIRGLDPGILEHDHMPVQFLQAEVGKDNFGVDQAVYHDLAWTADCVIQNGWPVDFNRHIKSFGPSIKGVENLVLFSDAVSSFRSKSPAIIFVSSVAVASNFAAATPTSRSRIPEAELTDWKLAQTGYGQSKLLAERILARAASSIQSPAPRIAIARVAQICGPVLHGVEGKWPAQEWLPSLIRSSIMLNSIPDSLGPSSRIDWVPVDVAARGLVDIATHLLSTAPAASSNPAKLTKGSHRLRGVGHRHHGAPKAPFFHIVNPTDTIWSELLPTVLRHLPSSVKPCSFPSWVAKLRNSIQTAGGFEGVDEGANPAAKLYDLFENVEDRAIRFPRALAPRFDTGKMARISTAIANLSAVDSEWMDLFMLQWRGSVVPDA